MKMKEKFKKAYMDVAWRFAQLSTAKRLQVGAIAVKDNRIISIGYNGMPSGWDNACENEIKWPNGNVQFTETKPEVIHAERNCLDKLARSKESSEGAVMFVTHTPCIECAKSIYNCGITEVYVGQNYVARKGCGKEFLLKSGVKIVTL